jgi:argininosuccinate lyase
MQKKLWGKGFWKAPSSDFVEFSSGWDSRGKKAYDYQLLSIDIQGSKAHCVMLAEKKMISGEEAKKILKGLLKAEELSKTNKLSLEGSEDVHSVVEGIVEQIAGGKTSLHSGRSRNDQVALDERMFLREKLLEAHEKTIKLEETLFSIAGKHSKTVFPSFTHHQPAMVSSFGHFLLSFAQGFDRDLQLLEFAFSECNQNPLGAAAIVGTSFPIDRKLTSELLGFDSVQENSVDCVSSRLEFEALSVFCLSQIAIRLSQLAESLMLLSMPQIGLLEIPEEFSTGSSMMPQKRNPDALEAIKAKASAAVAKLNAIQGISKGAFCGYNRDSQWGKYEAMDAFAEVLPAIEIMAKIVPGIKVNKEKALSECGKNFICSTHLLESLCQEAKIPFREGKEIVEKAVRKSRESGFEKISAKALNEALGKSGRKFTVSEKLAEAWQNPVAIITSLKSVGSANPELIVESSEKVKKKISAHSKWAGEKREKLGDAGRKLDAMVKKNAH